MSNKAAVDKIQQWLKKKGIGECPACRHALSRVLVGPPIAAQQFDFDTFMSSRDINVPMVTVTCMNCFYVMPFMAAPLGLLPSPDASLPG